MAHTGQDLDEGLEVVLLVGDELFGRFLIAGGHGGHRSLEQFQHRARAVIDDVEPVGGIGG